MWRVAISPPPLTECRRAGHQPVAHSVAGVTVCVCVEGGMCVCVWRGGGMCVCVCVLWEEGAQCIYM